MRQKAKGTGQRAMGTAHGAEVLSYLYAGGLWKVF